MAQREEEILMMIKEKDLQGKFALVKCLGFPVLLAKTELKKLHILVMPLYGPSLRD